MSDPKFKMADGWIVEIAANGGLVRIGKAASDEDAERIIAQLNRLSGALEEERKIRINAIDALGGYVS